MGSAPRLVGTIRLSAAQRLTVAMRGLALAVPCSLLLLLMLCALLIFPSPRQQAQGWLINTLILILLLCGQAWVIQWGIRCLRDALRGEALVIVCTARRTWASRNGQVATFDGLGTQQLPRGLHALIVVGQEYQITYSPASMTFWAITPLVLSAHTDPPPWC